MSECNWPVGAQYVGMSDGERGKVSELGKKYLSGDPYGKRGRMFYLWEYWHAFLIRKGAEDVCFIYYPNEREGTLDLKR